MIDNSLKSVSGLFWDVVIVGAGTVGLLAAKSLADKGLMVLCLESGGFSFDQESQNLNKSILTGENHLGIHEARGRVVGGTSTLWGGQLARFTEADFEYRSNLGGQRWPLKYEEVKPWYRQVADILNVRSYCDEYSSTLTTIYGEPPPNSTDIEFYVTHWLKVPNMYSFFKDYIAKNEKITLCANSNVCKLRFDKGGDNVESLLIKNSLLEEFFIRGKKIILANGTVEISRLLLNSVGDNALIKHKFIGKYFQDHLDITCGKVVLKDKNKFLKYFENAVVSGNKVQPKLRLKRNSADGDFGLNVGGAFCFESGLQDDIHYLKSMVKSIAQLDPDFNFKDLPKHLNGVVKVWGPLAWRYICNRRIMAFIDQGVSFRAHMEQLPLVDSAVGVNSNFLDKYGFPIAELNWKVDWSLQAIYLKKFCHSVSEFLDANNLAKFEYEQEIANLNEFYIKENSRDSFHQCGGAIMSDDIESGVVDKNSKVHGVNNLYIAGSAVFPSSSYANPTFTAMALVLKMCSEMDF